ncbi:hypothetical protein KKF82_09085, partial [Patescibacteria group bacterium]|nr:hypothetical protein [Patescibacteria group bacterium]
MRTNPYFVDLFGDVKSDAFAKDEWTTSTGIHVVPRGSGQQVRGLLFRNYRPDLIVVDDLEDDKLVLNEDYTNELWEWFNSSLLNSVDRGGNSWQIVVIGTLLHENSVLARLLRDDKWATVRVSLADQDLRSNWPEFISNEKIAELYQDFSNRGLADLFAREYCGEVVARQDAAFRQSFFRYYKEGDKDVDFTETVILVDPAKTARHTADYTAVVGVGLNRLKGHIYVRDVVMDRLEPEQMYEHVLAMALRLRARVIGLEVTSLNEFILQPFKNYMLKHGHVFELV